LKINVVFSEDKRHHKESEHLCGDYFERTVSKIQYYQDNEFHLFGLSIWNKCNKLKVLTKMYNFIKQYSSESITLYLDPKYKEHNLNEYFGGIGWTVSVSN